MDSIPPTSLRSGFELHQSEYEQAALDALRSGTYISGPLLEKFEKEFAEFIGVEHTVGLNSGLDALVLAIRASGIGKGDEVIVPANTYIATVMAITINGAIPIFCEPDQYFNIDPAKIEELVTEKTKAVLVVHLYGQACQMEPIVQLCKQYQLFLLEDCAQSHGAKFAGTVTGTFGEIGCFSFYPTKNLGAFGDAGAITTDNFVLADHIRTLGNYGSHKKYYNEVVGTNSRLDEIQAALLSVKLQHLGELTQERQRLASLYNSGITNPLIAKPQVAPKSDHIYHQYVIQCSSREHLQQYLRNLGIGTLIHYPIPPHLSEAYAFLGYQRGDFPITEQQADQVLSLPLYNGMTEPQVERVIEVLNRYQGE
ncbi:MAG: DegT/DnrJ/EryC1/StrS family aminotransferase [Bifidobacteriaceae bacterium]|jgi:dTDP-4-amino-4,6-dideoxygalactose transaminase|nr:DegT/DnrJ/EryC1/StrS family aminotransferase [Bifidobacteriaceae bacterium]